MAPHFLTSPGARTTLVRRRQEPLACRRGQECLVKLFRGHLMKSSWARMLCRLLMVLMIWSPMQLAQAGMIGTDQLVTAPSAADRTTVLEFLGRADVANQLQSLGLDAKSATERVAAMTDAEVQMLAGKINGMPAGADSTGVIILLLLVGAAVWWIWFRR